MRNSNKINPLEDGGQAINSEGAEGAEQLPARVERYSKAKEHASRVLGYLDSLPDPERLRPIRSNKKLYQRRKQTLTKIRERLRECGNWLLFHHYYTVDRVRLVKACTCKIHMLCPLCAIRRGSKLVQAYQPKVETLLAENRALRASMMTITVKNGEDLLERFNHLMSNFRAMLQRRRCHIKGKRGKTLFNHIQGMVYAVETTISREGWHPHIHAVILHEKPIKTINGVYFKNVCHGDPKKIPQDTLNYEWFKNTGDSWIVDVKPLDTENLGKSLCEVFKYAVKFSELPIPTLWHSYTVLKGKRLVGSVGNLRGVEVPESLLDEPLEGLPYFELFYRFIPGSGYNFIRGAVGGAASPSGERERPAA